MKKAVLPLLSLILLLSSCVILAPSDYKTSFRDINSFYRGKNNLMNEPFLKAHLKSGGLCIYTDTLWTYNKDSNLLRGNAKLYDIHRNLIRHSIVELNTDTVVLFESNRKLNTHKRDSRLNTHTIITAVDAALGVICISVPKACWGSCPTFYSEDTDDVFRADAEGFSQAIVPSMEYGDIDALQMTKSGSQLFSLTMKNEALETHVIRNVKVLAVERDPGLQVYHGTDDRFYVCDPSFHRGAIEAWADEGSISSKLSKTDSDERFSLSDTKSMKSREEVFLQFPAEGIGKAGLVLNFRQTLMTTYLIYSVMGYMGNTISDFMAEMEKKNNSLTKYKLIEEELGGIEVFLLRDGQEIYCGKFNETGPIAINQQLILLPELSGEEDVNIKLVMNKGLWRIDYASLVSVVGTTDPVELNPEKIYYENEVHPEYLWSLVSEEEQLVSMPGDEFKMEFRLPPGENPYELFLYSRGYYLEWMRESWLNDKNLLRLNLLVENPDRFFRKEAKKYSKYESRMEEIFWNSRINTEKFNYYE